MGLPKELRLVVYERIPVKTNHYAIHAQRSRKLVLYQVVIRSTSTPILATSQEIREEAYRIMLKKLDWDTRTTHPTYSRQGR